VASGSSPVRAIIYAFLANLGIAVVKALAWVFTGSSSMLAEAIHSLADTGNQLLLLLGLVHARRPPDREHPLGYGKLTFFWSFIVAVMLFSVGGLFSLYEGWHKLHETGPIENVWVALVVLVLAIGLESASMRACLQEVAKVRRGRSWWQWLNESRSSELVVVFGEDLAALLGLTLAIGFVLMAWISGDRRFDAYGSLAIGTLLVAIAIFLAVRIKALLIGRSADPEVTAAIREAIASDAAILDVFNVITVQVGAEIMVAAKLRLRDNLPLAEACAHINRLEVRLKQQVPEIGWSFMEPDVSD
jgi:cation diffusion facilitator family transporter